MATASKKEIVLAVASKSGRPSAEASMVCQSFLEQIVEELAKGNRLEFRDFGVFEIRERAPRIAQNPKTLERVPVPAKKTVKFKIGRLMKLALEGEVDLTDPHQLSRAQDGSTNVSVGSSNEQK